MQGKIVIALVGPQLAGKNELSTAIKEWCGKNRVMHLCTGDIIRSELRESGNPTPTREDCDEFARQQRKKDGDGFLAKPSAQKIHQAKERVIILDTMRLQSDEEMIDSLPYETVKTHVTAYPETRFARLQLRKRNGEEHMTWEEFLRNEELEMERLIRAIGERCHVRLQCDGTDEENSALRLDFCRTQLRQYAS